MQLAFQRLPGVRRTAVGYIGGQGRNPTYQQVCSGRSGHAEAVEVEYDPTVISLQELFVVFFSVHDATTLNRQGNDVGTQYRSAIFFRDQEEKAAVRDSSAAILFDDTAPSRSVSSQRWLTVLCVGAGSCGCRHKRRLLQRRSEQAGSSARSWSSLNGSGEQKVTTSGISRRRGRARCEEETPASKLISAKRNALENNCN